MSAKNFDNHNRWRNKTVAFRVSAEEDLQLETYVSMSGLTKQDYITRRLLCKDVVLVALLLILLYNGKRGTNHHKYFFYVFYPSHMVVLHIVDVIISSR